MTWRLSVACAVAVTSVACSSGDATSTPETARTLLVTNTTCTGGPCGTLEIRVFFQSFLQWIPENPLGLRAANGVGWYVPPGQKCFALDPYTINITGPDNTGVISTTHHTWTAADTGGIFLVAVDSGTLNVRGMSTTFAQANSPGWSITFPNQQADGAGAAMAEACHS